MIANTDITDVKADTEARRLEMVKNPYLRLLMKTVGIARLSPSLEETLDSIWTISSEITADQLKEYVDFINAAEFNPPTFENGEAAEKQLRRKAANRTRAYLSSDEDENEELFPAGGPTVRKAIDGEERPKKAKRRRRQRSQPLEDEELEERARKRRDKERERQSKIKSEAYVYDSDLDSDADREFFAKEEELRQKNQKVAEAVGQAVPGTVATAKPKKRKTVMDVSSGDEDEDEDGDGTDASSGKSDSGGDSEEEDELSSQADSEEENAPSGPRRAGRRKRRRVSNEGKAPSDTELPVDEEPPTWSPTRETTVQGKPQEGGKDVDDDVGMVGTGQNSDEEEDDVPVASARSRARVKGGFIMDSSDEDE